MTKKAISEFEKEKVYIVIKVDKNILQDSKKSIYKCKKFSSYFYHT